MSTSYQQLLQEAYDQKRAGKKKQLQAAYDRELAEITGLEQAADRQAGEEPLDDKLGETPGAYQSREQGQSQPPPVSRLSASRPDGQ